MMSVARAKVGGVGVRVGVRVGVAVMIVAAGGLAVGAMSGCSSTYYTAMEWMGKEKRDILVSRVESARQGQAEAKEQFQTTLDRFSALVNADGGALRSAYDKAKGDLDRSQSKADKVRDRIKGVESVGGDLFREWEQEIGQYTSADLKARSQAQLRETRGRYDEMLASMKRAEAKMDPVLAAFRDNVLSLKHSLNAQAVAAMRGTVADLEREIASLISEMEKAMAEADAFVKGI